jgi:hypothetical protein
VTSPDRASRRLDDALREGDELIGPEPTADEVASFRAAAWDVLVRHGLVPPEEARDPIPDQVLADVLGQWSRELQMESVEGRGSDVAERRAARSRSGGAVRLPGLEQSGVHPRFTWRVEGNEQGRLLVLRLATLDASRSEHPARLEAAVGEEPTAWWGFARDEQDDLVVRVPLLEALSEESLVLHLRWLADPPSMAP